MLKLIKGVGWLLLSLAGISVLCIPIIIFVDDSQDKGSAIGGFAMFTAFFGIPGALLLWRGKALQSRAELAGLIRVYDRFTAAEIAKKVGLREPEADRLILRLAQEEKLDLVFHRPDRSYMHRSRIPAQGVRVFDTCRSCGARLPHEVALEGENAACVYCGSAL